MLLPERASCRLASPFVGIGDKAARLFPSLKDDLSQAHQQKSAARYTAEVMINTCIYFLLFFGLLFLLSMSQGKERAASLLQGLGLSFLISLLIFYSLITYPRILAGKRSEQIEKHLIFALKDILLQVRSGVPLYHSIVNVSKAGYGEASKEFEQLAQFINTGMSVDKALERLALHTKSDFLKRTAWQLNNAIIAGASLQGALQALVDDLTLDQKDKIRNYSQELNLWILLYMLFAVAVPTIGATMLVILSSFAGFGIEQNMFVAFIIICLIIQGMLIGFVKTRRPVVTI